MLKPSRNVFNGKLLSETHELKNPYSNKIATPQQRVDLKSFYLLEKLNLKNMQNIIFFKGLAHMCPTEKKTFLE